MMRVYIDLQWRAPFCGERHRVGAQAQSARRPSSQLFKTLTLLYHVPKYIIHPEHARRACA
jgi:hypothetical protein